MAAPKGPKVNEGGSVAAPDLDSKIAELEAAKNVIGFLKNYPKETQERILNISGDILDCWTKRVRRTKAELAAGQNGGAAQAEQPAAPPVG